MQKMMDARPLSIKEWKIIRYALSYAYSNWDDVQEAFEEDLGPEISVGKLLERVKIEANEPRKLALCYFALYPKETPTVDSEEMWDSIDCTYQNWLNRLYEEPAKALSVSNWYGKVTKAFFKMIGVPCPTLKKAMVEIVTRYIQGQ